MSKWLCRLNIADVHEAARNHEITPQQLANSIAVRLSALKCPASVEAEKDELVVDFTEFSQGEGDFDDFDEIMEKLYDWADTSLSFSVKVCWVNTMDTGEMK